MTAADLPLVPPLMVRKVTPLATTQFGFYGGLLLMDHYDIAEVGLVADRQPYDEAVVDCSRRIFQITCEMMIRGGPLAWTAFPSRRWRNFREGEYITGYPTPAEPLLYLGNPILLFADAAGGIDVVSEREFKIKSGVELGF